MVLVTEIEDRCSPKPFLGGWRSVSRDLEYHDATSQTRSTDFDQSRFASVPTQTFPRPLLRDESILAGGVERAVQAGSFFPEISDWILQPTGSGENEKRRRNAAVKIQICYRAYRSRQQESANVDDKSTPSFSRLSGKLDGGGGASEDDDDDDDRSLSTVESLDYLRNRSRSRTTSIQPIGKFHLLNNPLGKRRNGHSRSDLAVLSNLLDRWSVAEEARIRDSGLKSDSRIAARTGKLERELEVLRAIDCSRSALARRRSERARAKFLDVLAKPVVLKGSNNVSIETLRVQRAREFRDMYEALLTPEGQDDNDNDDDDNDDEERDNEDALACRDPSKRVEVLYAVKKLAALHTCSASAQLENLIDQELYLLASSSRLEPERLRHLRSRVRLAFLNLARGALARHDDRVKHTAKTRLCPSCRRFRGLNAFETDHRERVSKTCVDCTALMSRRRQPELCLEIYERMLRELRRNEAARRDGASSLSFVIGPKAIRYLVNDIWHGRSVFSDCDELERLRLTRLDPRNPWTPWNNLLATRREARMHEVLASDSFDGPPPVYDEELVRKLRRLNLQARLYFESMARHVEPGISL